MQASRVDNKTKKKPFGLHTATHTCMHIRARLSLGCRSHIYTWMERARAAAGPETLFARARQGKPNRPSHASQPVRRNVAGSQGETQGRILEGEGKVLGGSIIITVGLDWIGMTGVCENFRQQHELVIMTVWKHWDLLIYCLRVLTTKRGKESFNGCSSSCRIR
jgi:hypothetical protein